jgi:hypothetical protein
MDPTIISDIQRWVQLDNKVELKKAKLKEYTDERKTLEDKIVSYIEEHQKTNVQIKTSDGYINFQESKTQQSISIKYVKEALAHYFDNQHHDRNEPVDVEKLVQFLLDNRETKTKTVMRRYIKKNGSSDAS